MYTSFQLAGAQFRSPAAKAFILKAKAGTKVRFVPEPENRFDANAIQIISIDQALFLGYVPKTHNEELLEWLAEEPNLLGVFFDEGRGLYAVIEVTGKIVENKDAEDIFNEPESDG